MAEISATTLRQLIAIIIKHHSLFSSRSTDYHRCCCGHCSWWYHCTYHWSPGWCSPVLLHHQVPFKVQDIFPPAAGRSSIWGRSYHQWEEDWTERECGLWTSETGPEVYWVESKWSLWACPALSFTTVNHNNHYIHTVLACSLVDGHTYHLSLLGIRKPFSHSRIYI